MRRAIKKLDRRIAELALEVAHIGAVDAREIVARLSGHSLRVGAAQDLAIAGRRPTGIMRAGRWCSVNGMIGHVRTADVNVWQSGRQPKG
jgi:hypothetical protein